MGLQRDFPAFCRCCRQACTAEKKPLRSARLDTHEAADALVERSDTTAIVAGAVVAEAVIAFELARCVREKFAGDHVDDMLASYRAYLERIPWQPRSLG